MTPEEKQAFSDYEEIKLTIRKWEDKLDEVNKIVLPFMLINPEQKIETPSGGFFSISNKTAWKYSSEIENKKLQIKKLEAEEVARGEAIKVVTHFVKYNSPKKEESPEL